MKRLALVVALVAFAGCKKAEQPAAAADTTHMMMGDSSKMMMSDSVKMMADTSKKAAAPAMAPAKKKP
jgi:uncharacterized lipoprotein YajG